MPACAQPRLPERAKLEHVSARFRALSDPARLDHRFDSPHGAARRAIRHEAMHIYYSLSESHVRVCMESAMEYGAEKQHSVLLRRKRHHGHLH
jgi:hypothetical protein